jgi:hypothetical protein
MNTHTTIPQLLTRDYLLFYIAHYLYLYKKKSELKKLNVGVKILKF